MIHDNSWCFCCCGLENTYTIDIPHHTSNYCTPTLAPAKGLILHAGFYNRDNYQMILLNMKKRF